MTGIVQVRITAYEEMLRVKDDKVTANEVPEMTVSVKKLIDFFEGTEHITLDAEHCRVEEDLHLDSHSLETASTQREEEIVPDTFCDNRRADTFNRSVEETPLRSETLSNDSQDTSRSFEAASSQIMDETDQGTFSEDDIVETINGIEDRATFSDEIEPNDSVRKTLDAPPAELRELGAPNPKPIRTKSISRIRRMILVGRKRFERKKPAKNIAATAEEGKSNELVIESEGSPKLKQKRSKKTGEQRSISKLFSPFRSCLPSPAGGKNSGKMDAATSVEITVPISTDGNENQNAYEAKLEIGLMVTSAVIKAKRDTLRTHPIRGTAATIINTAHTL